MRSLEEWLDYQTRAHGKVIDLGLDRPRRVLERLGWRAPQAPVITVAGTNGKGSVSACCASILAAAGYRVGTFTSPHFRDYRERIRIHDRLVSAEELVAAFERIEQARGDISLTFFEYNALAAFLAFDAAHLDAWVLEIGMGGRLDAVNLVDPDVAVVVSIGLDHQDYLGSTLEAIAREKAGIFRPGRPAILGSRDMPGAVKDRALEVGAPLVRLGLEFDVSHRAGSWHYRGVRWNWSELPRPALRGEAQFDNAATALAALEALERRLRVSRTAAARGLEQVHLAARFQVIRNAGAPECILDVAHNPSAARVLAANLGPMHAGRTFAVCGILADKDAAGIAAELRASFDVWWCVGTEGDRRRSGRELADCVAREVPGVAVHAAEDVAQGCAAAFAAAGPADRICIFGSFHTVGPAMTWLETRGLLPPTAVPEYTATPPNSMRARLI